MRISASRKCCSHWQDLKLLWRQQSKLNYINKKQTNGKREKLELKKEELENEKLSHEYSCFVLSYVEIMTQY